MRSSGPSEATTFVVIRWVVAIAIWVVIAALAPVIVSRYDIADHELWLVCSLLAIVLWFGLFAVNRRTPETRESAATYTRAQLARQVFVLALVTVPIEVALVLVVLGLFQEQEQALYLTAVGIALFLGALLLLTLVFMQRRPQTASDPAELPATGGESA